MRPDQILAHVQSRVLGVTYPDCVICHEPGEVNDEGICTPCLSAIYHEDELSDVWKAERGND